MKSLQFYKYAALFLLLINLALVIGFFLTAPPHAKRLAGKNASEILHLDKNQDEQFHKFADEHRKLMSKLSDEQRTLLNPYFKSTFNTENSLNRDSLVHEVQTLEQVKIESTYKHFEDIKSILRPEQEAHFDEFIEHALKVILSNKKKRPFPPKD